MQTVDERRRGVLSGITAYALWGLFPLYFPLLEPAGGVEIVAHRVLWSLVFIALLLTAVRRWPLVRYVLRCACDGGERTTRKATPVGATPPKPDRRHPPVGFPRLAGERAG